MISLAWNDLKNRYATLSDQLSNPDLEPQKRSQLQKEHTALGKVLDAYEQCRALEKELKQAQEQAGSNTDAEMAELFAQEIPELQQKLKKSEAELEELVFPADEIDQRSVFVEIRAGAGGQEAAHFAGDLQTMYTNYAIKKGWRVSIDSLSETDLKGVREVVLHIAGKGVYGQLKRESGVHRVQRVPQTETQGRIHTSTATVAVLPEAEEVDVSINPADLKIDTYRAGGAGGQHVNKTESAIRITHIPSGLVVTCQEDRSQHKNKERGMKLLKSRLFALQEEQRQAAMSKMRKEQVGTGMRAEKVRTYNFPQNRVTDHQVNLTLSKLDRVIQGDMEDIIEALVANERATRRASGAAFSSI
jgi:peptide chain release factor 1